MNVVDARARSKPICRPVDEREPGASEVPESFEVARVFDGPHPARRVRLHFGECSAPSPARYRRVELFDGCFEIVLVELHRGNAERRRPSCSVDHESGDLVTAGAVQPAPVGARRQALAPDRERLDRVTRPPRSQVRTARRNGARRGGRSLPRHDLATVLTAVRRTGSQTRRTSSSRSLHRRASTHRTLPRVARVLDRGIRSRLRAQLVEAGERDVPARPRRRSRRASCRPSASTTPTMVGSPTDTSPPSGSTAG